MARLAFTAAASLVLMATGSSAETIWSSVAFINNGDRTPLLGYPNEALTPLGAQQLFAQGTAFRARYLSSTSLPENATRAVPYVGLRGINPSAIVDSFLSIHSVDQQSITGGALAFMQALYPPREMAFPIENGGMTAANRVGGGIHLSNSIYQFPGNGTQYPRVQTASILDPNHVWLDGHNDCRKYVEMATAFQTTDVSARQAAEGNAGLYQSLSPTVFPPPRLNGPSDFHKYFYQANELYNYALYNWHHNATIRKALNGEKLAYLRFLASTQQKNLHGNLTMVDRSRTNNKIRAIAGRTFAARVLKALRNRSITGGNEEKLTLLFGSSEVFTAFFALSSLVDGQSKANFESIPEPGAAMVFELFSLDDPDAAAREPGYFPPERDLWVRFMYRSGTDENLQFVQYSIFSNPNSQSSMRLSDFALVMQKISVSSPAEWCAECGGTGQICQGQGYYGSVGSGPGSNGFTSNITPPVAGAIGALVTLAVAAATTMAVMVLGGFRIRRVPKTNQDQQAPPQPQPSLRGGGLGGFKGAEKNASDTDLAVARNGMRHERTGSWELRDGGEMGGDHEPPSVAGASFDKDIAVPMTARHERDFDAVSALSEMNATPVRPRESV